MEVFSHLVPNHRERLSVFTDDSPFQFLEGFTTFSNEFLNNKLVIAYSKTLNAFMPLRLFGNALIKFGQIQHAPISDNIELEASKQLDFFNELLLFCSRQNICDRFIQPHPYGILLAKPEGVKFCNFGSYIIDLKNQTEEEILHRFKKNYVTEIRQTENRGATAKFGYNVLQDFYTCHQHTMQNAGKLTDSIEYFEAMYKHLGEKNITTGVVYEDGNPIGSLFVIHTKYAAIYTHAGTMGKTKLSGRMKFLNWECIKRMKAIGVNKYDFTGVRLDNTDPVLEGIFTFKQGFGGDLKKGFLWKKDLEKVKTTAYDLLMKVKNPGGKFMDIIDQVNLK
jgi:Acetyltransferase (GNAT) domain